MHTLDSLKHPVALLACVCVQRDSLVFAALADVTLARKKEKPLILFPLSCAPITVFICPWADFNSAQQQESLCVCVCYRSSAVGPTKCPSIHLTHTCTHTSYSRWRSSSQCHFQFGRAHGLLRRYNGLGDGREMDDAVQVYRNKHSGFWSFHLSGAVFKSWLSLRNACTKSWAK